MPRNQEPPQTRIENLYARIADDEEARVCRDITDDACREVPENFFVFLLAHALTKVGDALANAKTVLPWAVDAIGAPVALVGMLVPLRESGSLLPQLALAQWIRGASIRKGFWILGSLGQAAALIGMAFAVLKLNGLTGGFALLGGLLVFSLFRGLASIASKDVLGKTVPKSRRGRLIGWTEAVAGVVVVTFSLLLFLFGDNGSARFYASILGLAALLWLMAALVFMRIREFPGATEGGANGLGAAFRQLDVLWKDAPFRRFVIVRSLLLCSALTSPFFIVLGRDVHGDSLKLLALFILTNGIASSLSAPIWGTLADRSSRRVMQFAAILTAAVALLAAASHTFMEPLARLPAWYPLLFGILGVAHAGVRLGRKTYLVDMSKGDQRTTYVAVSNSSIGVALLLAGLLTTALAAWSPIAAILVLSALGLGGAALAATLPEVQ